MARSWVMSVFTFLLALGKFLLASCNANYSTGIVYSCTALNKPAMFQGESLDIPKHLWKRSRGYRVGVKPHEKKRKYMLFIPSIIMGNVRAWESEFVALTRSQKEYLECSIMCVMEIWLHDHIPNSNMTINRSDRNQRESGKWKGRGLALLVNNRWCNPKHITIEEQLCSSDIDIEPPPGFSTPTQPHINMTSDQVKRQSKRLQAGNTAGPNGIKPGVLKACADQLYGVLQHIFNWSLRLESVPVMWKSSCLVPVLKKGCPSVLNDYRPVVLTCYIMKSLERLVLAHLRPPEKGGLDPLQFAYQANHWSGERNHLPASSGPLPYGQSGQHHEDHVF
ncbi:uncharacterized protein [Thunnus thynnus]|uniref:uncharacterized protein isoform X1 n=1 Tax=Thunnus thynnus TaxID=8237 RepID=UPI003528BE8F